MRTPVLYCHFSPEPDDGDDDNKDNDLRQGLIMKPWPRSH